MAKATETPSLVGVAEHQQRISALVAPTPVESRALEECLDLALAEDLTASIPLPPFDNSAMDGYAVRSADVTGASPSEPVRLRVAADIPAGRTDVPALDPGTAHRIMTGAPVPEGADATVPVERTDGDTSTVGVHAEVPAGAHVRRAGEDVAVGDAVLSAGTALGAAQLGVAAAVGAANLPVHRPPRVLVLSTGSELVPPGTPLRYGQIYESNGIMLAAAVRQCGGLARLLRFVPDDVAAFHDALAPYAGWADLIITSGGVSAGAYEVVKDALEGNGVEFAKVAMQPGMPQGAGRYRSGGHDTPVVTLPGNPVSSMVSFEVFVRPALRRAGGFAATHRPVHHAALTEDLDSPAGKRQYRRGVFDPVAGTVGARGGPGSHLLSAMAAANCLLEIDEETTNLTRGQTVPLWLVD